MFKTPRDVLNVIGKVLIIFAGHQPMKSPCVDCPFKKAAEGRDYLKPGRLDDIKVGVLLGQAFYCHKSVYRPRPDETELKCGDEEEVPTWHPDYKVCAGAVQWAQEFVAEAGGEAIIHGHEQRRKVKD